MDAEETVKDGKKENDKDAENEKVGWLKAFRRLIDGFSGNLSTYVSSPR